MSSRSMKICFGVVATAAVFMSPVHGASTSLATAPLVTSSTTSVLPNVLFVLDDSGSMDWDYMPDWANSGTVWRKQNAGFNGVAYDPAIVYEPPKYYTSAGALDTTTYPTQDSANTSAWTAVKNDGYGIQSTGTTNLTTGNNFFYTYVAGEFCDSVSLRNCQTTQTTTFSYPAKLRWCNSAATPVCQATYNDTSGFDFTNQRSPNPRTATIAVSGSASTSVSSITVDGKEILSAATTASTTASTVATRIRDNINACSNYLSGNCTAVGYTASVSGSTVTIRAPGVTTVAPVVTQSGTMTITPSAFQAGTVPGENLRTTITSSVTSYPYPGTATKAATRTDCAGTTCTYAEEMTNYANWWAYYRTRMQMTKSAASRAFSVLDENYRVGLMSINMNNINLDKSNSDREAKIFLGVADFDSTQRKSWYDRFFAAYPDNSTPLRVALSAAGRYFAGRSPTYQSVAMSGEPVQYVCQQNFTILSTDGFWNESSNPTRMDGTTAIGNQDSVEVRPFNDGGSVTYTKTTSQLQMSQTQVVKSTSQLQRRIQQLQTRTSNLQSQTSQLQQRTGTLQSRTWRLQTRTRVNNWNSWSSWSDTGSCTWDNNYPNVRQCQYVADSWVNVGACTYSARSTNNNNGATWTGNATECGYSYTAWTGVSSCAPVAASTGPNYTVASAVECQTAVTSPYANAASCTENAVPNGSGYTTQCQYAAWTGWANAASCTPLAQSGASPYTVATARECQTTDTGWVGASSCSAGVSGGTTTTCQTIATGPDPVASCTPAAAAAGNSYVQTTCNTNTILAGTGVNSCTAEAPAAGNSYVGTYCNTVNATTTVTSCTAEAASAGNSWMATSCSAPTNVGGTSNTLADVAQYYYATDLRARGTNVTPPTWCTGAPVTTGATTVTNEVCGTDGTSIQRMITFTLGLGANGFMQFSQDYAKPNYVGDYSAVKGEKVASSASGICLWQADGTICNWPVPSSGDLSTIDDLWHAGVNGRGSYFSATNPGSLVTGLSNALAGVASKVGASAAATTSNPNVSSGDNFVFSSTFSTVDSAGTGAWFGEVYRQQIDLVSGVLSSTIDWRARDQLDTKPSRTIYTYDPTNTTTYLKSFEWANLTAAEQAYFSSANISALSQFCAVGATCLSTSDQTAAAGAPLVDFIRGVRTNEGGAADITKYYRQRAHLLGDIVNAEAVYIKRSQFTYADTDYSAFVASNVNRQGMVYVAANDGMLHALNADTGVETWAYVPTAVMPNLWRLADKNYLNLHRYFVDGTPVQGEVYFGGAWHTILVGGLNGGGRGYYALDVTDPANPKALWEFTDTNLGFTYGNPEIGKLKDGTWVVVFASGYNNTAPGDGVGRLYVVNAATGALIRTISTGVGDATTPSGLTKIRTWVDNAMFDNTIQRVYAGDLLGNVWRFDVNDDIGTAGYDAQLLASLTDSAGVAQPITARPDLGEVSGHAVVFVGTGRFLGTPDLADTQQQSFYGIKDALTSSGVGTPRDSTLFVKQLMNSTTCPAGAPLSICQTGDSVRVANGTDPANTVVNFATHDGWFLDLPDSGERANTDPTLALGTLIFTTNIPNADACNAGGESYLYFLDYRTGGAVSTSGGVLGAKLGNALATRPVVVRLPNNTIVALVRMSGSIGSSGSGGGSGVGGGGGGGGTGEPPTLTKQPPIGNPGLPTRRVSWRELISDN